MTLVDVAQIILLVLILISSVLFPLMIYLRVTKSMRGQVSKMASRLDQNLGTGPKLLEVRDYYQQTSAALKKMLDDAYKEGNRHRQEEIRRLIDRLETMKTRALDKSVAILESGSPSGSRPRRRRSRRPRGRRRPQNNNTNNTGRNTPRNGEEKKT